MKLKSQKNKRKEVLHFIERLHTNAGRHLNEISNNLILFAILAIPMTDSNSWIQLRFKKIPSHQIVFNQDGLQISVNRSAQPLIHQIASQKISGFKIRTRFMGLPKMSSLALEGQKNFDDYPLKVGFVISGTKKLNWSQRLIAADWVKQLFDLAPKNKGIDHIEFYNFVQNEKSLGQSRVHPLSDLIKENFSISAKSDQWIEKTIQFEKPISVEALWISADGDDTQSAFKVEITQLELLPEAN